ncbi:MAG: aminopeptidase P family protein [Spartobacteria bacterium]|nr:aminopeptidase P family protein [Spartobacteria bacterium]
MQKELTIGKLLIGNPSDMSNIRYITGFSAPDAVIYLDTGTQRFLAVSPLEYGRAVSHTKSITVVSFEELKRSDKTRPTIIGLAVELIKRQHLNTVRVSADLPYLTAKKLLQAGIKIDVVEGPFLKQRAIKRPDEVARIREVQQAAVIACRAAVRKISSATIDGNGMLRDGTKRLDSESMRRLIDMVLLERDCVAEDTIVACGKQGAQPHERGSGPLMAGQPIVIDIFPRHKEHGYWGDLTRTVIKGRVSQELLNMYRAVKAAQRAALSAIKPRVHVRTVHRAAHREFNKRGYISELKNKAPHGFIHGTGHGVGLDIHEAPSVSNCKGVLRAGHVITVEPGLYYPELGGIRIEDTVVVMPDGWRYLYPCEKKFFIA